MERLTFSFKKKKKLNTVRELNPWANKKFHHLGFSYFIDLSCIFSKGVHISQ